MSDFIIENKNLTCEKIIAEFDIPVFFICIDEDKQRYYAMAIGVKDYIVGKVSDNDIVDMLSSNITLRDFVLKAEKKWRIDTGECSKLDRVTEIGTLKEDELPKEGEYLDDDSFCDYIREINREVKWEPIIKNTITINMNEAIAKEGELVSLEYPIFSKTIKFSLNFKQKMDTLYRENIFIGVA